MSLQAAADVPESAARSFQVLFTWHSSPSTNRLAEQRHLLFTSPGIAYCNTSHRQQRYRPTPTTRDGHHHLHRLTIYVQHTVASRSPSPFAQLISTAASWTIRNKTCAALRKSRHANSWCTHVHCTRRDGRKGMLSLFPSPFVPQYHQQRSRQRGRHACDITSIHTVRHMADNASSCRI